MSQVQENQTVTIDKDWTMQQVLTEFPSAKRALFQGFHIGGCQSCGYSMDQTIQEVCDNHQKPVDEVIAHIYKSDEIDKAMQMSATEARQWIGKEEVKIVDVREPWEAEESKIDGSHLLDQPLMVEIMTKWPKDTPILAYCAEGVRSNDFASYLVGHGFTKVKNLSGGIRGWAAS